MDFTGTLEQMLAAAKMAAGVHWKDMQGYLTKEFAQAKDDAAAIAREVVAGTKTVEQAKIELQSNEESLRDVELAAEEAVLAAAQDAINAALGVLRQAINAAVKIPIL
jgi:predicted  nucleic acid-binding Zn-ribbon protein